ncbi:Enhancer of polycomb-like protein [Mycena kentingensis (nom. inval.)]|nr:Enhancer of polycomb-like protein [Mycena kentingensis (nom. inval.)]
MAPRANPPPKKNKTRFGVKYSLHIVRERDLPADTEYLDDAETDNAALQVADVDVNEGHEHHLQAALATTALFIPTPCALSTVDSYTHLYPDAKWKDPITYLHSTTTVEEACLNALADHNYTYLMDEQDKQWLDKNNQDARGEGTSASGAATARASRKSSRDKDPEIGVPASINEDEFELVMGIMEKLVDQKVLRGDPPEFDFFERFFLEPLPPTMFATYTVPSWVPQPALLVRIARTIYPHWKHRRALLDGCRIQPAINFDESDFANESYICFRRRDNKPTRKTRGSQVVNHAEKLTSLHHNLTQALDVATALLQRETVKQAFATESQAVWVARQPMADFLRQFPSMVTKADEERLLDKPKKIRPKPPPLPKVKVLPPTQGRTSASPAPPLAPAAIQPSERCAEIQQDIARRVQQDAEILKRRGCVDLTDEAYQTPYLSRPEKLWVDPTRKPASPAERAIAAAQKTLVRGRIGRGGRFILDRRNLPGHPYPSMARLQAHRTRPDGGDPADFDEEATRRLEERWRFDSDASSSGFPEEEGRELVDEYDSKHLVPRLKWAAAAKSDLISELTMVTDASLMVPTSDGSGRMRKALPVLTNAIHLASMQGFPDVQSYLVSNGISGSIPQRHRVASSSNAQSQAIAQAQAQAAAQRRHEASFASASPSPAPIAATPTPTPPPPTSLPGPLPNPASGRPRALRDASHSLPNGTHSPTSAAERDIASVVKPSATIPTANGHVTTVPPQNQNQNHMPPPPLVPTQMNGSGTRAMYVPVNGNVPVGHGLSVGGGYKMPVPVLQRSSPLVPPQAATPSPVRAET